MKLIWSTPSEVSKFDWLDSQGQTDLIMRALVPAVKYLTDNHYKFQQYFTDIPGDPTSKSIIKRARTIVHNIEFDISPELASWVLLKYPQWDKRINFSHG